MSATPFAELVALAQLTLNLPYVRVALFRDGAPPVPEPDVRFVRSLPLHVEGAQVGFLTVMDRRAHEFGPAEQRLLEAFGTLIERDLAAGIAVARSRSTALALMDVLEAVPIGTAVLDLERNVRSVNAVAAALVDWASPEFRTIVARIARGEAASGAIVHATRPGGAPLDVRVFARTVFEGEVQAGRYLAILEDASVERTALAGEDRFDRERAALLDLLTYDVSVETVIERVVAALEASIPHSKAAVELLDGRFAGFAPAADYEAEEWSLAPVVIDGETAGNVRLFEHHLSEPLPHYVREAAQLVAIAVVRERERTLARRLAQRDPVTELPNRIFFEELLEREIVASERSGRLLAVAAIDLDGFRHVNDSLGHSAGDQLLREVASRFSRAVGRDDVLARLGGDEFLVLFRHVRDRSEARERAERLLRTLTTTFSPGGHEVTVRASVGIALCPRDANDPRSLLTLCERAVGDAKARGGEVALYEPAAENNGLDRLEIENRLARALDAGEFELVYQPQIELATGRVAGAEALIRWQSEALGFRQPAEFIGVAEQIGLIVPIGAWVMRTAARRAREWQDAGRDLFVAVNVSARQFEDAGFVETVAGALAESGLEPRRLMLEITEGLVMRAPEEAAVLLRHLKRLGVSVVVDDFGTGYSGLDYLRRLPLDGLKIDKAFVRELDRPQHAAADRALIRAILAIAAALGLRTVAEGIERVEQMEFLRDQGCELGQGFFFGRPRFDLE